MTHFNVRTNHVIRAPPHYITFRSLLLVRERSYERITLKLNQILRHEKLSHSWGFDFSVPYTYFDISELSILFVLNGKKRSYMHFHKSVGFL